jgi:chorismate synthase
LRHGDHDVRANLERASARETASRVAAGAVCQLLLRALGCEVLGHVVRIGDVASGLAAGAALHRVDLAVVRDHVEASEVGVLDAALVAPMKAAIDQAKADRDTLGGVVEVVSTGVPPGLGTFAQWDRRLDGRLAQALMSIQAFKAVEIGAGVAVGRLRGSQVHDAILPDGAAGVQRPTNRAGGLEGGVSNGEPLVLRATKKPIATLRRPLDSVDLASGEAAAAAFERSDVCAVPAASVIAEAMVAIVLAEASLDLFGGASLDDFVARGQAHAARAAAIRGGSESP